MKTVFLDSDVLLDYLANRLPFQHDAERILNQVFTRALVAYTTPVVIANVHYVLKRLSSDSTARDLLKGMLKHIRIISVGAEAVQKALQNDFTDFEDALQHEAAVHSGKVEVILTRNIKDYRKAQLPVMTPGGFLLSHNA